MVVNMFSPVAHPPIEALRSPSALQLGIEHMQFKGENRLVPALPHLSILILQHLLVPALPHLVYLLLKWEGAIPWIA